MSNLPSFDVYCDNTSGHNALRFQTERGTVYYSYKTPIAFCGPNGLRVRENDWGPTTGKHMNAIDSGNK